MSRLGLTVLSGTFPVLLSASFGHLGADNPSPPSPPTASPAPTPPGLPTPSPADPFHPRFQLMLHFFTLRPSLSPLSDFMATTQGAGRQRKRGMGRVKCGSMWNVGIEQR